MEKKGCAMPQGPGCHHDLSYQWWQVRYIL